MNKTVDQRLLSAAKIAARIEELAEQITADFLPDGEITIVPILTGSIIFTADLIRQIKLPLRINLITVSSYPGTAIQSQGATILSKQLGDIHGRHVLLIDDILDSGTTIRAVVPILKELGAVKVKVCVLLSKNKPEAAGTPVDFVGFDIPDEFVVGYGLDYDNYFRNLPDIVTLK
jgi:hypoxanthine phosphoribosyltransferase